MREATMFGSALNAFKGIFTGSAPPRPSDEELFLAFFDAEDWAATTHLLDLYQDALLTDSAQIFLIALREFCMVEGRRYLIPIVDERRHLLALCRVSGIPNAISSFPSHTRRQALEAVAENGGDDSVPTELQLELLHGLLLSDGDPEPWNGLHELLLRRGGGGDGGAKPADQMLQLALLRHQRATYLHFTLMNYADARESYAAAIQTCAGLHYLKGLCLNMHPAGIACMELGEEAAALEYFTASAENAKRCNYLPQMIQSQRILGKRLLLADREAEARAYLLGSLQLAQASFELDEALLCAAQVGAIGKRCNDEAMLLFAHKTMQEINDRRQGEG
jgi:tetratricopeptide (TPR) repeat protein